MSDTDVFSPPRLQGNRQTEQRSRHYMKVIMRFSLLAPLSMYSQYHPTTTITTTHPPVSGLLFMLLILLLLHCYSLPPSSPDVLLQPDFPLLPSPPFSSFFTSTVSRQHMSWLHSIARTGRTAVAIQLRSLLPGISVMAAMVTR